ALEAQVNEAAESAPKKLSERIQAKDVRPSFRAEEAKEPAKRDVSGADAGRRKRHRGDEQSERNDHEHGQRIDVSHAEGVREAQTSEADGEMNGDREDQRLDHGAAVSVIMPHSFVDPDQ